MLNSQERKLERLNSGLPDSLSPSMYNVVLLGTVLYGFVINALMVPVLGPVLWTVDYRIILVVYLISCLGGTFLAANDSPLVSFIGYNLIVLPIGALLSVILPGYGSTLVMQAILLTGGITLTMLALGALFPNVFLSMGKALGVALLVSCVLSIASWFIAGIDSWLVWGTAILFTLYIGYDLARAQAYPRTLNNAVDCAIDLYLDVINLFLRVLRILARLRSDD